MFRRRFFVSTLLSIPVLLYSETLQSWLSFSVPAFPGSEWINPVFAVVVFAYGGVPFIHMAVPELKDRAPGMMTLISMAISVAFVYSLASVVFPTSSAFFWELVTLIDVMLLGHWIEMRSVRQASSALDELAKLMPDTAERITDSGDTEKVPVSDLSEGDLVLVRPGASVPADGVVNEGDSDVNEAMITGESKPVSKEPGDEVIGGTVNGDGSLRVRIGATGDDTTLAGIMRLVEQAQSSKSKTQVLADRAAGWLSPYLGEEAGGIIAYLVVFLLIYMALSLVIHIIDQGIKGLKLKTYDRLMGGLVGAGEAVLLCGIVFLGMVLYGGKGLRDDIRSSTTGLPIIGGIRKTVVMIPDRITSPLKKFTRNATDIGKKQLEKFEQKARESAEQQAREQVEDLAETNSTESGAAGSE